MENGGPTRLVQFKKQGRLSSIGAKILFFVLMQLTDDFKEEKLKKNLSYIENQSHILLNNNMNSFVCSAQL